MHKQKTILVGNLKPALTLTLTLLIVLGALGTVQAQDGTESMKEKAPIEVTEIEAASFAKAFSSIQKLQDEYTKEAQGVENDSEIRKVQKKYQDKMVREVKKNGLTIKRYNEIAQTMQKDEELRKKIGQKMNKYQQQ